MAAPADAPRADGPALLALAAQELAVRAAWCVREIAEECYLPRLPPNPWAGRDVVVGRCRINFDIGEDEASAAVDAATNELWAREQNDSTNAQRRLMLERLRGIRRMIRKSIDDGHTEETYKYKPHPAHADQLIEALDKKKVYKGVSMSAVAQLREVERDIAALEGLEKEQGGGGGAMAVVTAIFHQLDEAARREQDEQEAAEAMGGASKALLAKTGKLTLEGKGSRMRLLTMIAEATGAAPGGGGGGGDAGKRPRTKKVRARVRPLASAVDEERARDAIRGGTSQGGGGEACSEGDDGGA